MGKLKVNDGEQGVLVPFIVLGQVHVPCGNTRENTVPLSREELKEYIKLLKHFLEEVTEDLDSISGDRCCYCGFLHTAKCPRDGWDCRYCGGN